MLLVAAERKIRYVKSVCATVDRTQLVTGSYDKTARVWSLVDGTMVRVFKGHTRQVDAVCTTLDGKQLITGSSDCTARLRAFVGGASSDDDDDADATEGGWWGCCTGERP